MIMMNINKITRILLKTVYLFLVNKISFEQKKIKNLCTDLLYNLILNLYQKPLLLSFDIVKTNNDEECLKDNTQDMKSLGSSIRNVQEGNLNSEEYKRIERIEKWFKEDLINEEQKEKLVSSGKSFSKNDLIDWIKKQDTEEFLQQQSNEKDEQKIFRGRIMEWLENVEESNDTSNLPVEKDSKSNLNPVSKWSPSSSESGPSSTPKINLDMDQITGENFSEFLNYDYYFLMLFDFIFIYIIFFIIVVCILTILKFVPK